MPKEKLLDIKRELIKFTNHVETMITNAIEGLKERDEAKLKMVLNILEPEANNLELSIDDKIITILAQFHLMAKDLRLTLMMLKMNNDLERAGDIAENIARDSLDLISKPPFKPLVDIPRMAEESISMLKDSINAFINEDSRLAREVCLRDDIVDNLYHSIVRELLTYMMEEPKLIKDSMKFINIAKNLERLADLSTNIGEDVVYIVEGKVIKHSHFEEK